MSFVSIVFVFNVFVVLVILTVSILWFTHKDYTIIIADDEGEKVTFKLSHCGRRRLNINYNTSFVPSDERDVHLNPGDTLTVTFEGEKEIEES